MTSREIVERKAIIPGRAYDGGSCPNCGSKNWIIGRTTAECGRCGHAMQLPSSVPGGGTHTGKRK